MKNLKNAEKDFQKNFETLIKNDILTLEDLKNSEYYTATWENSYDLAEAIVHTNSSKADGVSYYNGYNREDWAFELSLSMMERFETMAHTFSSVRIDEETGKELPHNYTGYTYSIFKSKLSKEMARYIVKKHVEYVDEEGKRHRRLAVVKEKDANGNSYTKKYKFVSGNQPLKPDDPDSICLQNSIESNQRTEDNIMDEEDMRETRKLMFQHFCILSESKVKNMAFAFIEDMLMLFDQHCSLPYMLKLFENSEYKTADSHSLAINYIVTAYNRDMECLMNYMHIYDPEVIRKYYATSVKDFGAKYAPQTKEDFNSQMYRFRWRYKKKLEKQLGIKLNKKSA